MENLKEVLSVLAAFGAIMYAKSYFGALHKGVFA